MSATPDGRAGDADYGIIGRDYARYRQPDPHIAAQIVAALGDAATVLNVGAGAGSYEPTDRDVVAVEPSAAMRAQRPASLPPAIDATAEALPFAAGAFAASLATFTVHQWRDLERGLAEMRRVTRGPVVILTCDPDALQSFWLDDYCPEVIAAEARRYPPIERLRAALGGTLEVSRIAIPLECRDGFNEAYYGRPERLLDPRARQVCSGWSFVAPEAIAAFERRLDADLASGAWDRRYGALRTQPFFEGPLRLLVARP